MLYCTYSFVRVQLSDIVESEKLVAVVDPELPSGMHEDVDDSVLEVLKVAILCLRNEPEERPSMDQVQYCIVQYCIDSNVQNCVMKHCIHCSS